MRLNCPETELSVFQAQALHAQNFVSDSYLVSVTGKNSISLHPNWLHSSVLTTKQMEKSTKQASTLSKEAAPRTSLHAAARGDPVLKAGLNKLLCSDLQGAGTAQPGAVSAEQVSVTPRASSRCIHRVPGHENRLGSQWHPLTHTVLM